MEGKPSVFLLNHSLWLARKEKPSAQGILWGKVRIAMSREVTRKFIRRARLDRRRRHSTNLDPSSSSSRIFSTFRVIRTTSRNSRFQERNLAGCETAEG